MEKFFPWILQYVTERLGTYEFITFSKAEHQEYNDQVIELHEVIQEKLGSERNLIDEYESVTAYIKSIELKNAYHAGFIDALSIITGVKKGA